LGGAKQRERRGDFRYWRFDENAGAWGIGQGDHSGTGGVNTNLGERTIDKALRTTGGVWGKLVVEISYSFKTLGRKASVRGGEWGGGSFWRGGRDYH